jgi:tetratricopeptide (TPR) repeat protein
MRRCVILTVLVGGCMFDPGKAQQLMMQANMRAVQKDYVSAIGLYDQALAADPTLREAYFQRAIAYRHEENFERAIANVDAAMKLGLDGSMVYVERARIRLDQLVADAKGDRQKLAAAFGPDDPMHIAADLDHAIVLDGLNLDAAAQLLRGAVRLMQNRDADAQADFERYLRRRPKAQADLAAAVEKWKKERPVLDLAPIDELAKVRPQRHS